MKQYRVAFAPEAEAQLLALYAYIAEHATPKIAAAFTDAVVTRCESLGLMPRQGVARGDLRPGLRTISFRRRVVIAHAVDKDIVAIVGIFYGGQDYETLLRNDDPTGEA